MQEQGVGGIFEYLCMHKNIVLIIVRTIFLNPKPQDPMLSLSPKP